MKQLNETELRAAAKLLDLACELLEGNDWLLPYTAETDALWRAWAAWNGDPDDDEPDVTDDERIHFCDFSLAGYLERRCLEAADDLEGATQAASGAEGSPALRRKGDGGS